MTKDKWPHTANRYIAYLDIMGFKDSLQRNPHHSIYKRMIDIGNRLKLIKNITRSQAIQSTYKSSIIPIFFSDSIIFVTKDGSKNSAKLLIETCEYILGYLLFQLRIPVKGAIAYGRLTSDITRSIHFGLPLIDAYTMQNDLMIYGIALHHSAEARLHDLGLVLYNHTYKDILRQHVTPLKNCRVKHFLISYLETYDYYSLSSKGEKKERKPLYPDKPSQYFLKYYSSVSGPPRLYVDNSIEFSQSLEISKTTNEYDKSANAK